MSCVNKAILVGWVGQPPKINTFKNGGGKMASLSLATTKKTRNKDSGERESATTWHRVVVFQDGLVSTVEQNVKKGSHIYVEGEILNREWKEKTITEIVLRDFGSKIILLDRVESSQPGSSGDYDRSSAQDKELEDIPF